MRIEDYAIIGDLHTAALVGRTGSIDWLCVPRFDSGACFAALLGDENNGCWSLTPAAPLKRTTRRYRPHTLILETEMETEDGVIRLIDHMPHRDELPQVVRIVEGVRGSVPMRMRLIVRYDYGWIVPWVRKMDGALWVIAGPDTLCLQGDVPVRGEDLSTVADFTVAAGQKVAFTLSWLPANRRRHPRADPHEMLASTERRWVEWASRRTYKGEFQEAVERSLITLKALTFHPSGGLVAAPTTSLPEQLGGVRNWDYRFCWVRDATFALYALSLGGYNDEAKQWRDWLLRAVAGDPSQLQVMYGLQGERRLTELELPWLRGYENSRPVRVGNAASEQFQLDIYGEMLDAMHVARRAGVPSDPNAWAVEGEIVDYLRKHWHEPDQGLWEVRGPRRHFTHSKVMAWVGMDRAVKAVERFGLEGPVAYWKRCREAIRRDILERAWCAEQGYFAQSYGSDELDASLLLMPLVGFLPLSDERMRGTVKAIERDLTEDGFVCRYRSHRSVDGLPPGEGVFLPCSFWLVDNLALMGERERAHKLFQKLLGLCNDVGLLSEEYDMRSGRLVGNFPQAFTHVGLINSAWNLSRPHRGPAEHRSEVPSSEQPLQEPTPHEARH